MHLSKEEFQKKLEAFFQRHDPSKTGHAHRIASRFVNHQDEVFRHLSDLYHEKEGIDVSDDALYGFGGGTNPFE